MRRKLSARWVLGFDGTDHILIEDGEIVFEGDRIVRVGVRSDDPADEATDHGAALIAPGFIDLNALADVDTTILGLRGERDRRDTAWSRAYAEGPRRDVLTPEQRLWSARSVFAQLLLSGITTALPVTSLLFRRWAEDGEEFDRIAALAGELGIRLVLGPSFRSAVNVVDGDGGFGQHAGDECGAKGLADAIAFAGRWAGRDPLVSALLVPSTIETCSDELLRRTADAARDLKIPFRLHCCQSRLEAETVWQRCGRSSLGHLAALGVLGPAALLPHAVELGGPARDPALAEADLAALAGSGATVVHCPLVIGRGGRRLESFAGLRRRGIRIGLGTDTAPPDMRMNLQMGLAMARTLDGPAVGPEAMLCAATTAPAEAIGRPDLGRLQAGAGADMVVWDLSALPAQPVHDPVDALFLMLPGPAREVWVAGRRSVADGRVTAVPDAPAAGGFAEIFAELRASFTERHWRNRPWQDLFPPAFTPARIRRAGT